MQRKYWPFDVLPHEDQNEEHRQQIDFFNSASLLGFECYMEPGGSIGCECELKEKGARLIVRGRQWEVVLGFSDRHVFSAIVTDFDAAAKATLAWLQGSEIKSIEPILAGKLVKVRGMKNPVVSDTARDIEKNNEG